MRILILPIAAFLIVGLCAWKLSRTHDGSRPMVLPEARQPAPLFELYDQQNPSNVVRLSGYVGRHRILVIFFDGKSGADRDRTLLRLRQEFEKIKSNDTIVLAISEALPQENRQVAERSGAFPFPLLSDLTYRVHEEWGRIDKSTRERLPGVFLIDRAGLVAWSHESPRPLSDPDRIIDELIGR